ncbi:hypothetical protein G6546_11510 [Citrobacter portucalensis]|uniref:hypothetical protein n=1 Tax=Citrobacter portucalensis TaxID=1639133 RepID=UPI000F700B8B|nr:hypothetical protein [Citrobacter portucalensis]QMN63180.1 hypothetical protein HVW67_12075 [Citrobacter freundii]MCO4138275.1 hypothetical protein [Citrobacter portucalensis]MCO4156008.1 hypothetical protein [Citrobacter portucalensis]NHR81461.1 hypothetical protein [Citrobacter portucalensis]VEC16873.1 Uncharacterised protein [Citrobacter portucalensis]
MKKLLVVMGVIALSGCVVSQKEAQEMDNITLSQCAVSDGLPGKYDNADHNCRKELLRREQNGQITKADLSVGAQGAQVQSAADAADETSNATLLGSGAVASAINNQGMY